MTATLYRMDESGVSLVREFSSMDDALTVFEAAKLLSNGHEYMIGNTR